MEFAKGPRQQIAADLPALTTGQLLVVAGGVSTALHLTFMAYGHGIGADRIHELEEFGRSLPIGIKNGDLRGMNVTAEPAVIEAIHNLVSIAIPKVERLG